MPVNLIDLGLINFDDARQRQKDIFLSIREGSLGPTVIFCRHQPVITLGSRAKPENILLGEKQLQEKGIELYRIERGGEVTYHGPGQFIAWPVFNLSYFKKDIHFFLRFLEGIIIEFLKDFDVKAERKTGFTGVWVGVNKIASIGIAIRNWISFYGLSINIKQDDLANFKFIRPCGMDIQMTSLEQQLGRKVEIDEVKLNLMDKFSSYCGTPSRIVTPKPIGWLGVLPIAE